MSSNDELKERKEAKVMDEIGYYDFNNEWIVTGSEEDYYKPRKRFTDEYRSKLQQVSESFIAAWPSYKKNRE